MYSFLHPYRRTTSIYRWRIGLPSAPTVSMDKVFWGLPYALAIMLTTSFTKGFCTFTDRVLFYPLIRVLSPHPCFTPSSVFYPLIRVLSPHPCFIPSSVFYPLIRVLPPHPCFIPSSVFYPLIRVLSPHPCFIPSSVFYPLIRVLSPHPCFIPSSVFYPLIRIRIRPSVSGPVFYPNPSNDRPATCQRLK